MSNSYYNHAIYPTPNSPGSSAQLRSELQLITTGFDKLPTLTGNAYKVAAVNAAGTALVATSSLQLLSITSSLINSTPIGSVTPAAGAFTSLSASGGYTGTVTGNVTGNLTGNVVGNVTSTGASSFSSITISGGTINGTVIGNSSPQAITGTLITASTGFSGPLTGNVTGNLTGNVTGNVTGNLTGNVTGNVTGNLTGNVTASSGTSTFSSVVINGSLDMDAGSSATIINLSTPTNAGDAANKGYVDTADALRLALAGGTMSGAIAMGTSRITGLGDPVSDQDAATKIYVDNAVQGLDAKASVRAATTANITLSGAQTIDGVSVVAGNRVLVKDQSTQANNGIYVAASGSWSRAPDANTWDELVHAYVFVEQGTANGSNGYLCTVAAGGTLGSTAVTWVQFSGAGQITAGAGLTKTGNTLNVNTASSARIVVGSDDIDLATTGVSASTYRSVTVDTYGRVTAGTNPTTLSGYGITDAYTTTQVDNALALKLNLTGGTMSGAIAMGTNRITGMGDPVSAQDATTKNYIDTLYGSTVSAAASAAAAAISASNAATSEGNASSYASAALGSANNAATSLFNFKAQYLGAAAANPTVDGNGNALTAGDLYYNTASNEMRVYSGSAWTAAYLPAGGYASLSSNQTFTGDNTFTGNTVFSGSGYVSLNVSSGVGIGSAVASNTNLLVSRNITGATSSYGVRLTGVVQSDATTGGFYFDTSAATQATSFTTNITHYRAAQGTFGLGSTVTNQYGFRVDSTLVGAANDYGFYSDIAAGTGRWNFYANGTADNYLGGSLGLGSTTLTAHGLRNSLNITGATTSYGYRADGTVQSGVTTEANYFASSSATVNSVFTLSGLNHFTAVQGTFGGSSTVTNQRGFYAASTLIGATNNYGFYSDIATGTNRWNFYANGTAENYFAGKINAPGGVETAFIDETTTVSATAATGTINYNVLTQSILYYTTNASGNFTVNIRGNASTSLNTMLAIGETVTVTFLVTNSASAYYNTVVQVDGSTVTPKWQGGIAPSAGNASSIDVYVYTVIKTAAATFTVLASQTKFA